MADEDITEAVELEQVAEWRLRLVDAQQDDSASAAAARHLQKLADEVRAMPGSALLEEYRCICNWLGESDDISDLNAVANEYRKSIGFGQWPETGRDYLLALVRLAQQSSGSM